MVGYSGFCSSCQKFGYLNCQKSQGGILNNLPSGAFENVYEQAQSVSESPVYTADIPAQMILLLRETGERQQPNPDEMKETCRPFVNSKKAVWSAMRSNPLVMANSCSDSSGLFFAEVEYSVDARWKNMMMIIGNSFVNASLNICSCYCLGFLPFLRCL